jgi:hypothetical protein
MFRGGTQTRERGRDETAPEKAVPLPLSDAYR